MKQPNFFIIGAPKCGTTSMAAWLGEHPQIFMSDPKEPRFFDTDMNIPFGVNTLDKYLYFFQNAGDQHLAVGEASATYLLSHIAVKNILEFNPAAKFIVMLRNPVDMARSVHGQWVWGNYNQVLDDFEEDWYARHTDESLLAQATDWLGSYENTCKLGEQIQRLLQTVDAKSVLFIVMDDLINDPLQEYQRVLEFLDVPYDGKNQFSTHNTAKRVRNIWLHNLSNRLSIGSMVRWPRIRWFFWLLRRTYYYFNTIPHKTQPLRPDFKQELIEVFREDVKLLSSLLRRDFSHWLR
jgi:hypothetical protein